MSVIKQPVGARTALAATGLSTLAAATYAVSAAYDCTVNQPTEVIVEVQVYTSGSPTGNRQAMVFIQESLDGTNYRSGPTSGTTVTDETDLRALGAVPMNTANVTHIGFFPVMLTLGFVPAKFRIVVKNDCGTGFGAAAIFTSEISATVT
jgi:hypothetical protein